MTERIVEIARSPDHYTKKRAKQFIIELAHEIKSRAPDCDFFYSEWWNGYKLYRTIGKDDLDFIDRLKTVKSYWKIIESTKSGIHPIGEIYSPKRFKIWP